MYTQGQRKNSIPPDKIKAWIERNFDYKTRKNGAEYCINSPFSDDTGYNFNINPEYGKCHSWHGDEWAGKPNPKTGKRNCSFINFVRLYKKCSFKQAIQDVLGASANYLYIRTPEDQPDQLELKEKPPVALPVGSSPIISSTDQQSIYLKR
jgi:hypothetical protein